MQRSLVLLACAFFPISALLSDDFKGAKVLLENLDASERAAEKNKPPANPVEELLKRFAAYRTESDGMPPEQAAAQWLNLFDNFLALPAEVLNDPRNYPNYRRQAINNAPFFTNLPPTAAWDAVAKSLKARAGRGPKIRNAAEQVLAAILSGNASDGKKALESLKAANSGANDFGGGMPDMRMQSLAEVFARLEGRTDIQLSFFIEDLEKRESLRESVPDYRGPFAVPDLASLTTPEKANALLRRALTLKDELGFLSEKTARMAAEIARKNIDLLKAPQWGLVRDLNDAPLYEAMRKRFPGNSPMERAARSQADIVYLASMIAGNRLDEGVKFSAELQKETRGNVSQLGDQLVYALSSKGFDKQLTAFFKESLTSDPALPFWQHYIDVSARSGESERALSLLRQIASQPDNKPEVRTATDECYSRALLGADHLDEGIDVLRGMIKAGASKIESLDKGGKDKLGNEADTGAEAGMISMNRRTKQVETCLQLARIGSLLGRAELTEEGIADARRAVPSATDKYFNPGITDQIARFLVSQQRYVEAESFLGEQMKNHLNDANQLKDLFKMLAVIYDRAGRSADVMLLLDSARQWGTIDVASFTDETFGTPMLYVSARALLKTGHVEPAKRAVERLLEIQGGYDPAYELLLEMGRPDLEAHLETLSKRDRFEERPLIWKAKLQLGAGRVDDAEATVRKAIAIDPSDGEEGKGDRMRAYAVLADVLEKKGDLDQAKIMRGAVEAIRLSEDADDWWTAGLLTRSVRMYEKALGHFADAYCIQSRLALRYTELRDFAKAEQHYVRAFELMPSSFGRIESHCFGCEGAFRGEQAQGIAERVFTQLAEKMPDKPQVFYLLGYLRQEQGKMAEAAEEFRKAVQLDPDYFNAWNHLLEVSASAALPQTEIDSAILALLRLDPASRHATSNSEKIGNLRAYWNAILAAEKTRPPTSTGPIYALAASKMAIENRVRAAKDAGDVQGAEAPVEDFAGNYQEGDPDALRMRFMQESGLINLVPFLEGNGRQW